MKIVEPDELRKMITDHAKEAVLSLHQKELDAMVDLTYDVLTQFMLLQQGRRELVEERSDGLMHIETKDGTRHLRTLQKIQAEWLEAYRSQLQNWPPELMMQLTDLVFLGHRLLTEASILGQLDGVKEAAEIVDRAYLRGLANGKKEEK